MQAREASFHVAGAHDVRFLQHAAGVQASAQAPEVTDGYFAVIAEKAKQEQVLVVQEVVKERDLNKYIRPHLSGRIIKSERLDQSRFKYIPLVKVDLTFIEEKGFLWKSQNQIPENLYLNYKTRDLFYVHKQLFLHLRLNFLLLRFHQL